MGEKKILCMCRGLKSMKMTCIRNGGTQCPQSVVQMRTYEYVDNKAEMTDRSYTVKGIYDQN